MAFDAGQAVMVKRLPVDLLSRRLKTCDYI
jgi:hypothetical protein